MIAEDQIEYAMDLIAKKHTNVSALMYDMQNLSSVDHNNAGLREWLSGMTDDGYSILIERLARM